MGGQGEGCHAPLLGYSFGLLRWLLSVQWEADCLNWILTLLLMSPMTWAAAAAAKSLQSCPTLCDPIDGSPPGSAIPGLLQARTLEWVAVSFSNAWKWKVKGKSLSRVRPLATPWTAAYQAPPSMGFSRQEYWSGVPLPSPMTWAVNSIFVCLSTSHKVVVKRLKECNTVAKVRWMPKEGHVPIWE